MRNRLVDGTCSPCAEQWDEDEVNQSIPDVVIYAGPTVRSNSRRNETDENDQSRETEIATNCIG